MEHGKKKCLGCIQIWPGTSRKGKINLPPVELGVKCHMFLFSFLCLQLLREWQQELSHPHRRLRALGLPHTPGNSSPFWWNRQYSTQLVKHVADQLDSGLLVGSRPAFWLVNQAHTACSLSWLSDLDSRLSPQSPEAGTSAGWQWIDAQNGSRLRPEPDVRPLASDRGRPSSPCVWWKMDEASAFSSGKLYIRRQETEELIQD